MTESIKFLSTPNFWAKQIQKMSTIHFLPNHKKNMKRSIYRLKPLNLKLSINILKGE